MRVLKLAEPLLIAPKRLVKEVDLCFGKVRHPVSTKTRPDLVSTRRQWLTSGTRRNRGPEPLTRRPPITHCVAQLSKTSSRIPLLHPSGLVGERDDKHNGDENLDLGCTVIESLNLL